MTDDTDPRDPGDEAINLADDEQDATLVKALNDSYARTDAAWRRARVQLKTFPC